MRRSLILLSMLLLAAVCPKAQSRPVSGLVTEDPGNVPLAGATVAVKGTAIKTVTDEQGRFTIKGPDGSFILEVSFVGFIVKEVPVSTGASTVSIGLSRDNTDLTNVVVTALGISKQARTLTYSTQSVKSEDISTVKTPNLINSLNGKVAGVQINRTSGGIGGAARITLRGDKSTRSSQPLFVIDGLPVTNPSEGAKTDIYASMPDNGDILSTINPDDIESINFLKGASASALYGSAGSNGVILISTRKGKSGTSKLDFSSSLTLDKAYVLPQLQYRYLQREAPGTNYAGSWDSWGNKGSSPDHVKDFYQTGSTWINSIGFTSGSEKGSSFFSYSNTDNKGIIPTSRFEQNNINYRSSTKLLDNRLTVDANFMGSLQKVKNRITPGTYFSPLTGLYLFPRGLNFADYANNYEYFTAQRYLPSQNWWNLNLDKKFTGTDDQQNPYWILNRNPITTNNKNAYAAVSLNYKVNDWLSVQTRGNYNYYYSEAQRDVYATTLSVISGTNGKVYNNKLDTRTLYGDALLIANKALDKNWNLGFTAGASIQDVKKIVTTLENAFLQYPNIFSFSNLIFPGYSDNGRHYKIENHRWQTQSVFASAQLGFQNKLFLDLTDRQEWSSTLTFTPKQTYNYYSVGANAVLTDVFKLPAFINFAKLRASYATVGNGIEDNRTNPQPNIDAGSYISPEGSPAKSDILYLRPELNKSIEIGTEWRLLNNRLSIDATWYKSNIKNQFIKDVTLIGGIATGTKGDISAGNIQNTGVEIIASYKVIAQKTFTWTTGVNFTANKNKIIELFPPGTNAVEGAMYPLTGSALNYLKKGGSFGDIYGSIFKRTATGQLAVDTSGAPQRDETTTYLGNPNPKWILGWNNSFTYRKFTLNVLIDGKFGGRALSLSEPYYDAAGVSKRSADARDAGGVVVANAVKPNGDVLKAPVDAQKYYTAVSGGGKNVIHEAYMYSATAIRFREFSLSYRTSFTSKTIKDLSIGVIGSNLFFFKKSAPFDPEQVSGVYPGGVGIDVFGSPAYRSIGISVKCGF
ncbi:TonB-linked outer membrane protein, SusC/RagA family [Filimonas lacunae]|uniref:TonB-linked outer membrane protein, SusC/RagA family n=1 Tax=Filimonas lacunae TaxID=477680 RepID=A0A173MJI3_9BACT|nr:SusC/RagA family TonB-linked outer membrane protein [Filimonas lacunae]BAV07626.1 outer membrane protein, nutrient binding [Filimonas lacunae]SIT29749.1 TonB-linked outer membrane protein, SusC/RagA family [Filimonas lacunae]